MLRLHLENESMILFQQENSKELNEIAKVVNLNDIHEAQADDDYEFKNNLGYVFA